MIGVNAMGEISDMLTMCVPPRDDSMCVFIPTVVVTTFTETASIVEELEKNGVVGVFIRSLKIERTIEDVEEKMKEVDEMGFKELVLHIGSESDGAVKLEQQAVGADEETVLKTDIDCENLAGQLSSKFEAIRIEKSENSGRSLESNLYYSSLQSKPEGVILVNVPQFDETITVETIAEVLRELIRVQLNK